MGTSKKLKTNSTILLMLSLGLLGLAALLREAALAAVGAACLVVAGGGLAKK
jgi:hypothetical protein